MEAQPSGSHSSHWDRRWRRAPAVSHEQPRRESTGVKVPSYLSGLAVFLPSPTHVSDTLQGLWAPCCLHNPPPPPRKLQFWFSQLCGERGSPSPWFLLAWGDEETSSSAPTRLRSPSPVSNAAPPCWRMPGFQARPSSQAAGLCSPPSLSSPLSVMPALNVPTCSALTHLKTTEKGPFVTPLLSSVAALLPLQKLLFKKSFTLPSSLPQLTFLTHFSLHFCSSQSKNSSPQGYWEPVYFKIQCTFFSPYFILPF